MSGSGSFLKSFVRASKSMRAVIQRVTKASCTVGGELTGSIDTGLVVLLGD